ncbi:hypothetical protein HDU99_004679 [Rhizoclosmatium hyalinum]|nr:hypothetical protein HDU99_004679 [Rhizoclosmatium hyalinum]
MAPKKEIKGEPAKVQVTITIPFETPRLALIASQVLSADRNPKDTTLVFGVDESNPSALKFTVESRDVKLLRTAVTSVMESIQLVSDGGLKNTQNKLNKYARQVRRSAAEWNSGADSYATSDFNSKTTNKKVTSGKDEWVKTVLSYAAHASIRKQTTVMAYKKSENDGAFLNPG